MTTSYTLYSHKLNGRIEISFEDGLLKAFELHFKPALIPGIWRVFKENIPYAEEDITGFESLGLRVVKNMATNEKIGLFCRKYESYRKLKYKASRADGGKIAKLQITEPLLEHYFTSENFLFKGKWSVSNLVRYYNELRDEMVNGSKTAHPNEWKADYAAKLKPEQLQAYWAHLRGCGLVPKRNSVGNVVDWVPSTAGN